VNLLIYAPKISPRLNYIFDFIFTELLGLSYQFTNDIQVFTESESIKIQYAENFINIPNSLFIKAHPLLFEPDIKAQNIEVFDWQQTKAFFKTDKKSIIPYDIFAASFYLLVRYEEHLPFQADKYGRFTADKSIAFKHNFIKQPIIDIWAGYLKSELLKHYPLLEFKKREFQFIPTIDIDNAYAYSHKGFLRSILSSVKLLFALEWKELIEKIKVHLQKTKDPYDSYLFLKEIHSKYNLQPIYFFLTAKYARHDKNISPNKNPFKDLVQNLSKNAEIGIHPSFKSSKNKEIIRWEKEKLEAVSGKKISKSRQHFLILKFPTSYRNLIKLGIAEDYSMGYASTPGFRAGTCTPFYFFDLMANEPTKLKIIPFALMDVGLKEYNKLNAEDATKEIKKIIEIVKNVNGLFVSLWHNESLGSKNRWKNWKTTYEELIKDALNK
jgi:hypothetical protein